MTARDPSPGTGGGGAPPLPRDPRPPARETHARTLPPLSQPLSKDRPKD